MKPSGSGNPLTVGWDWAVTGISQDFPTIGWRREAIPTPVDISWGRTHHRFDSLIRNPVVLGL